MSLGGRTDALVFGRDPKRSTRLLLVAAALFLVSSLGHLSVRFLESASTTGRVTVAVVFGTMFLVAVAGAYANDGLLVSVALAAGVGIGFYAPVVLFDLADPGDGTLWVLTVGTVSGVVTGVLGFVVGAGGRRLVEGG